MVVNDADGGYERGNSFGPREKKAIMSKRQLQSSLLCWLLFSLFLFIFVDYLIKLITRLKCLGSSGEVFLELSSED